MEVSNKTVKYLTLLLMLIELSASMIIERPLISSQEPESRENKMKRYRLPNITIPHQYHLFLEPFMDNDNLGWIGDVSIDIEIFENTSILTLHAHYNLKIMYDFTELFDAYGTSFTPIAHYRNDAIDLLVLQYNSTIQPGNYSLNIRFTGEEICCLNGFFKHKIGGNRTVAVTSFEPTAARRAFPCWDEPGLKARFRVTIKHSPKYTVISNMPRSKNVRAFDGMTLTDFPATPIMSTYLLNIVISDYPIIFNDHENVSLHTDLKLENVKYLLDLSSKVVDVMESYTGVSFGFSVVSSVLIPFYPTNATEHWGLVSYNEGAVNGNKSLLTSAKNDSTHLLVAQELAHSWFGSRVTPLWWDDLWLNEAFAVYFQYYIMDQINDSWGGIELFVLSNNQEGAFPADTEKMNPIRWSPITKREIMRQYKSSTHQKGAAIVHMFRNVLGNKVFRAGIQKYMAKNSFKSVVTNDLTNALQEAYNEGDNKDEPLNLTEVMAPWLEQKGYPIIKLTRNYTSGYAEVIQRTTVANDDSNIKWWIPLTIAKKSNPNFLSTIPIGWLSDKEKIVWIPEIDNDDWVIMNVQASGYYRVNYDDENWDRLANYLNTNNYKDIHVLNRAQLISDAFYLAQREPDWYYRHFYNIIKYLAREDEYLPWRAAHYAITRIAESLIKSSEAHRLFTYYIFELMQNFVDKVGFEPKDNEHHYNKLARMDIIEWACLHGHTGCATYAAEKIIKLAEDPVKNKLHPDIRGWAFCAGLRGLNDTETLKFVAWAQKNAEDSLIENIGCTENHKVHKDLLYSSFDVDYSGEPFTTAILESLLASSEENFNFAVNFFIDHQEMLHYTFFLNSAASNGWYEISDILSIIANQVKTYAQLEKFKKIFQLEGIIEDSNITENNLLTVARYNVNKTSVDIERFLKRWDKQLSIDENNSVPRDISM